MYRTSIVQLRARKQEQMTHFHIVDSWRYSRYEVPWESATGATFLLDIRGIRRFFVHISQTENFLSNVLRLFLFINTQERTDNLIFILSYLWIHITVHHRVDRVLGFFSSRPNWDSPMHSLTRRRVFPPSLWFRGRDTRLRESEWGVPIQTRGQTLWYTLYIRMYFVLYTI
jgi:hypothetical protein